MSTNGFENSLERQLHGDLFSMAHLDIPSYNTHGNSNDNSTHTTPLNYMRRGTPMAAVLKFPQIQEKDPENGFEEDVDNNDSTFDSFQLSAETVDFFQLQNKNEIELQELEPSTGELPRDQTDQNERYNGYHDDLRCGAENENHYGSEDRYDMYAEQPPNGLYQQEQNTFSTRGDFGHGEYLASYHGSGGGAPARQAAEQEASQFYGMPRVNVTAGGEAEAGATATHRPPYVAVTPRTTWSPSTSARDMPPTVRQMQEQDQQQQQQQQLGVAMGMDMGMGSIQLPQQQYASRRLGPASPSMLSSYATASAQPSLTAKFTPQQQHQHQQQSLGLPTGFAPDFHPSPSQAQPQPLPGRDELLPRFSAMAMEGRASYQQQAAPSLGYGHVHAPGARPLPYPHMGGLQQGAPYQSYPQQPQQQQQQQQNGYYGTPPTYPTQHHQQQRYATPYGGGGGGGGMMMQSPGASSYYNAPLGASSYYNAPPPLPPVQPDTIFQVQFKRTTKCFTNRSGYQIQERDFVVVEGDRGEDIGVVLAELTMQEFVHRRLSDPRAAADGHTVDCILRLATMHERQQLPDKYNAEKAIVQSCNELAMHGFGLPIMVYDAEFQFDRNKLTIYYECNVRIDFRDFVRQLYSTYKARIWMKIGNMHTPIDVQPLAVMALATGVHFSGGNA